MRSFLKILYGERSDPGDRKPTNQDSIFSAISEEKKSEKGIFVVADGVGGLSSGEDISNLIGAYFERWFESIQKKKPGEINYNARLNEAIKTVNAAAVEYSKSVGERMGSTIAMLFIENDKFFAKNVGDSRVYLYRKGKLTQLTEDHSLVEDLVKKGEITKEEAKSHPKKNVLTMCIGVNKEIDIFTYEGKCKKNDMFLICSDGLYNFADPEKVMDILGNKKMRVEEKVSLLRETIPKGNAKDNVSIILVSLKKKWKI